MPRQRITFTALNDSWLKSRAESREFLNKSEVVNELIRKERLRERETERIHAALAEGEASGYSDQTVDEIWAETRKQ